MKLVKLVGLVAMATTAFGLAGCGPQETEVAETTTAAAKSTTSGIKTSAASQGQVTSQEKKPVTTTRGAASTPASTPAAKFVDVDPAQYLGRDQFPIFDFHNGGTVTGYCMMFGDSVACGIGENSSGDNEVLVTGDSVQTLRGEGPMHANLNKLNVGERITWAQGTCERPDATSVECSVGANSIRIEGPNYALKKL